MQTEAEKKGIDEVFLGTTILIYTLHRSQPRNNLKSLVESLSKWLAIPFSSFRLDI